ncbi:carbohydate-binding domain-containing protein [Solitalea sp. MAHUQ-68]|uniref:beta-N-acetylhexosaminidase n=1 Tax=Solitalea agri TaxID=2953739 RepID=A0A9X2F5K6_9SPHI|nr:family 20 glycosylhydrolase [Solitalea agri]MCO4292771.1 carbohydate-binding domain-containing protein [Solitalea agri]
MNKHAVSLMFFVGAFYSVDAQQLKPAYNPNELKIQWKMIENGYMGQGKYLSSFTLNNASKNGLPAKGWSIYFNLPRGIDTSFVRNEFKFEHINGDLNRIMPTALFKGLKTGQSIELQMLASDWSLNRADAPSGLYLVWDDEPQTGIALANYQVVASTELKQINRAKIDIAPIATPEVVYNRNKVIEDIPANKLIKVFPTPINYSESEGSFVLTSTVTISADPAFSNEANYLAKELGVVLGKQPTISSVKGNIELRKAEMGAEAYTLSVSRNGIIITASTPAGAFYGIQSLKTLMPAAAWNGTQKLVAVPLVEVKDEPRFGWRAFMLDVARNFQTKEEVLKTLDWLALYKINVFHFHCTEDEGWRIEIPGLPELTEIGGKRGHKNANVEQLPPSFASGPDNSTAGSGFYSKADFIEILKYANERHIKVIPEIESPGHARAAVQSMQVRYDRLMKQGKKAEAEKYLLRELNDKSVHSSVQGWNDNVMDVSLPSTYTFVEKVVDGLIAIYKEAGVPLETIHMGGDEVPSGSWEKSPAFAKLKQENPLVKNTNDLWYYYYGKVNEIIKSKGLYLYGWEEAGMRKTMLDGAAHVIPNPDFANQNVHLDVWNNVIGWGAEDLAYRLANAGYKVVLSPVSNLYFDMSYDKDFEEEGYYWGGFVDVDKPYSFIPFDYLKNTKQDKMGNTLSSSFTQGKERLTDFGKTNIIGIQGLLFAETITSAERMEYMLMPKLLGLAERAWAKDPEWSTEKDEAKSNELYAKAWSDFVNRIGKRELPRLSYYKGGLKYRIPTAGAIVENGSVKANVQLPGFVIRYTTNGTEPTSSSKLYTEPVATKGTIKLRVFDARGRGGRTVEVQNK